METPVNRIREFSSQIAELTFQLLANCQEKEERLAGQFGITAAEFRTLRMFRDEPQLTVKVLVERVGLSGSRLSRILEALEEKGYLGRSIDSQDRRSIDVSLTPKGVALARNLEKRFVQVHEEILEGIPEELHEPLLLGLQKMLASVEKKLKEM